MKKPNVAVYLATAIVIIGLMLQFMDMGLFGNNPIPEITKYNQILFWGGIAIWSIGYMGKASLKKQQKGKDKTNLK